MNMDIEEKYHRDVLDPLRAQASPEVWEGFITDKYDLNWYEPKSFEVLENRDVIGVMNEGSWVEY